MSDRTPFTSHPFMAEHALPYATTAKAWVFQLDTFIGCLAAKLGAKVDKYNDGDESLPRWRSLGFTLDGVCYRVSAGYTVKLGSATIIAGCTSELVSTERDTGPRLDWPRMTVDASRPLDRIAADLQRKLAPTGKANVAALRKRLADNTQAGGKVAAAVADILRIVPGARHAPIAPDATSAEVSFYDNERGSFKLIVHANSTYFRDCRPAQDRTAEALALFAPR